MKNAVDIVQNVVLFGIRGRENPAAMSNNPQSFIPAPPLIAAILTLLGVSGF